MTITSRPEADCVSTLVVDLDGCLVRTDLLIEGMVRLLRQNPLLLALVPLWLLRGKAHLKMQIATRTSIDLERLPYNPRVIELMEEYGRRGARIVLATASHISIAEGIARYLGQFDRVLASDGACNLQGAEKLRAILGEAVDGRFAYAGNAHPDVAIWRQSSAIYVVDPSIGVEARIREMGREPVEVIRSRPSYLRSVLRAIRPHQWLKNVLVFVPILAAHRMGDPSAWISAALIFLAFGLTASFVYILNDLLDLDADRSHPRKRNRPFAAGDLQITDALVIAPLLLAGGLLLSLSVGRLAALSVVSYAVASCAYTFLLKRYVIIDVLALAGLYTLRILAGAAATLIVPSFWLLAFSMFFFLSLATMKRAAELMTLAESGVEEARGRNYMTRDMQTVRALGIASGYLSVLVLALYMNAPDVVSHYATPQWLWAVCVLLLYWIGRLWIKTDRGEMHDDPVVYALTDWNSRVLGLACAILHFAASMR